MYDETSNFPGTRRDGGKEMSASTPLAKIDARIEKLKRWKQVLSEMVTDPEGRETIRELSATLAEDSRRLPSPQRRLVMPARTQTKVSLLGAAILEAGEPLGRPFSTREIMEVLLERGYQFSRNDRMTEIRAAMRRLIAEGRITVEKEKEGTVGRLYALPGVTPATTESQ